VQLPGQRPRTSVGPYQVTGVVGQGGMATVFRVLHPTLRVERAVKVLTQGDPSRAARFAREAQALARLRHPNVVGVHETGVDERGAPYFVMDLVPGRPLERLIAERAFKPEEGAERRPRAATARARAMDLALQVARGVAALHAAGLVHRDLKPGNVVVTPEGKAVVVDLGLAYDEGSGERLTRTGAHLGTPQYLAPEQLTSAAPTARTDVHALGLLAYELLTGEPAFDAVDGFALAAQVLADARPRAGALDPSVPAAVDALVARAMAKEPAARHADAADFAADLERCLATPGATAGAVRRRRRLGGLALSLVGASALLGALFGLTRAPPPPPPVEPPRPVAPAAPTTSPPAQATDRSGAIETGLERTGVPGRRMQLPVALLLHGPGQLMAWFADARHLVTAERPEGATTLRVWSLDDVREPVVSVELAAATDLQLSGDRAAILHVTRGQGEDLVRPLGALDLAPRGEARNRQRLLTTLPDGRWVVRRAHVISFEVAADEASGGEQLARAPWDLTDPTVASAELVCSVRPTETVHVVGVGEVNGSELAVWSRAAGWQTKRVGFAVTTIAASPRGATLVVGTYLGGLDLLRAADLERGVSLEGTAVGHEREALFTRAHGGPISAAVFDPDGTRLITASSGEERGRPDRGGVELRLWDVAEARQLALTAGLERTPTGLDISPDGRWLAVATREGVVEVWALPRERR
jgi:hypothetical protein